MQGWTGCSSLATPSSTSYTAGPTLTDSRDGHEYEIRKLPDGKCWMVDNLRYGGSTDACAGRTAFSGYSTSTATNRFGSGTYGDCRDPRVGGSSPCLSGTTVCGYYYNWQAAMQHASAYAGSNYQPTQPVTGICPSDWHVPSSSEFSTLNSYMTTVSGGIFKGVISGSCSSDGTLASGRYAQGNNCNFWTSNQGSADAATIFYCYSGYTDYGDEYYGKYAGFSIRCVKN